MDEVKPEQEKRGYKKKEDGSMVAIGRTKKDTEDELKELQKNVCVQFDQICNTF